MVKKKSKPKKNQERAVVQQAVLAKAAKVKGAPVPKISNHADGSCTIAHQEFCMDITALALTTQGSCTVEGVNPQRATLFTWLSAIATRFEMYRFEKLRFMYKPSCSTTLGGFIVIGFDFDAYDQPEGIAIDGTTPTKAEILTWKYSVKAAPWQETTLDLSGDSRIATYRYCDLSSRGDKRLDLLGNLVIRAVQTFSSDAILAGELFVDYTVRFRQPSYKIPPALYSKVYTPTWPSLTTWFTSSTSTLGNLVAQVVNTNNLTVKDAGNFLVNLVIESTGLTGTPTMTASVPTASPSANFESALIGALVSSTRMQALYTLKVETPPVLLTFSGITGSSTGIASTLLFSTYAA